jgi:hypothetical protein
MRDLCALPSGAVYPVSARLSMRAPSHHTAEEWRALNFARRAAARHGPHGLSRRSSTMKKGRPAGCFTTRDAASCLKGQPLPRALSIFDPRRAACPQAR